MWPRSSSETARTITQGDAALLNLFLSGRSDESSGNQLDAIEGLTYQRPGQIDALAETWK